MKNFDVEKRNRELQRKPLLFDALDIRNIFVKTEKELLVNNICKDAKYKEHKTLFDGLIIVGSE